MRVLMKSPSSIFNSTSNHLDQPQLLAVWYVALLCSMCPSKHPLHSHHATCTIINCRKRLWMLLFIQVPSRTTTDITAKSAMRNVTLIKWEMWSWNSLCARTKSVCVCLFFLSQGFKFKRFPYILTLHLKRFDFDYSTMQRIKLNDRWVWPLMSCDF